MIGVQIDVAVLTLCTFFTASWRGLVLHIDMRGCFTPDRLLERLAISHDVLKIPRPCISISFDCHATFQR